MANTIHETIAEYLDGVIDVGTIESAAGGANDGIEATITGYDDGEGEQEQQPGCELWSQAPLQFRPLASTEVLFLRRGDEIIGIATKDRRVAVVIDEGEAVLTNLKTGSDAVRVRLRADGEIVLEGAAARFVDAGDAAALANKALALAQQTNDNFSTFRTAYLAHTHAVSGAATGPLSGGLPAGDLPTPFPSVESARVFSKD